MSEFSFELSDDEPIPLESNEVPKAGTQLVIGSDETRLIEVFETGSFSHAYEDVCVENLRDTIHVFDAVIRRDGRVVWGFERKEHQDLIGSMFGRDERWKIQHADMQTYAKVHGCYACYVIEGSGRTLANARGMLQGAPISSLRAALAHRMVRDRMRVVRTEDMQETAQFLMDMAWAVKEHGFGSDEPPPREDAWKYIPIGKSERMTPENAFRLMFAQVPGFGQKKAKALADHFVTPARFARQITLARGERARISLVSAVPGVAKKLATDLLTVWFGSDGIDWRGDEDEEAAPPPPPPPKRKTPAKKAPKEPAIKRPRNEASNKKRPAKKKPSAVVEDMLLPDDDFNGPPPPEAAAEDDDNIVVLD